MARTAGRFVIPSEVAGISQFIECVVLDVDQPKDDSHRGYERYLAPLGMTHGAFTTRSPVAA
jgi:hypothetical protein